MEQTDLLLRADQWLEANDGFMAIEMQTAAESQAAALVRDLVLALRHHEHPAHLPQMLREQMDAYQNLMRRADAAERALRPCMLDVERLLQRAEKAEAALRLLQAERDEARMAATQLLNAVGVAKDGLAIVRAEHEADLRRGQAAQAALVGRWRTTADALIEDVNNGHAPSHESDFARGMLSCADELAALIPPAPGTDHMTEWRPGRNEARKLQKAGYDGLYHPSEPCGCWINDLYPCGERPEECQPGRERHGMNGFGIYAPAPAPEPTMMERQQDPPSDWE